MYATKVTLHNARRYGYANSRVRSRVVSMLGAEEMQQIASAKDISGALVVLMQSNYREDIEHYGGMAMRADMLDFALNRNLARNVGALLKIVPRGDVEAVSAITRGWEVSNIEVALNAKVQNRNFESISKYLIDLNGMGHAIEEAMGEGSVEEMVKRLMKGGQYLPVLKALERALREGKDLAVAEYEMGKEHLALVNKCIAAVAQTDAGAGEIMASDMRRRGIMLALRAKRRKITAEKLEPLLSGSDKFRRSMISLYAKSEGVEELASKITEFNLAGAVEEYKRRRQMIIFDMHMRNSIFSKWQKVLRRSMLSLGTVMAYAYVKEIEIYRLKDLIKSKEYGIEPSLSEQVLSA